VRINRINSLPGRDSIKPFLDQGFQVNQKRDWGRYTPLGDYSNNNNVPMKTIPSRTLIVVGGAGGSLPGAGLAASSATWGSQPTINNNNNNNNQAHLGLWPPETFGSN